MVYPSKPSYDDRLKEAGLRWHPTQAINPERSDDQILLKREEIKKKLEERQDERVTGQRVVFAEDECH